MHLDTGRGRDVGGGDQTRALLAQVHHDRLVVLRGDDQLLDVEDQVGDVLLDARHGGELVQHAVDTDGRDRRTRDRGQKRPAQGVSEGVTEARLQRLDHEPGTELVDDLFGQGRTLSDQHVVLPPRVWRPSWTPWSASRVRAIRAIQPPRRPTRPTLPRQGSFPPAAPTPLSHVPASGSRARRTVRRTCAATAADAVITALAGTVGRGGAHCSWGRAPTRPGTEHPLAFRPRPALPTFGPWTGARGAGGPGSS